MFLLLVEMLGGQDGAVRYEVAVRRLRTIAERCQQVRGMWPEEPMLTAAYAFGEILDGRHDVDVVQVAFVLDLPADEVAWGVNPQSCAGLPHLLEIDKAPVEWHWRPAAWPVANHLIRRPLRIWSVAGLDLAALAALEDGEAEGLRLPEPSDDVLAEQLAMERSASLAHLRSLDVSYWERDWRRGHRGLGMYPENHLYDAVHGYLDLLAPFQAND